MALPSLDLLSQAASTCISRLNISLCASSVILSISSPTTSSIGQLGLPRSGAWLPSGLYSQKVFRSLVGWAPFSGAVCFSPLSIILPSYCWIYDHGEYRTGTMDQKVFYWFHWLLFTRLVCLCALVGFMPSPTRFILHTPQAPVMVSLMNFSLTILQHAFLTGRRISPNIMLMV
jgi:hypothetical protein